MDDDRLRDIPSYSYARFRWIEDLNVERVAERLGEEFEIKRLNSPERSDSEVSIHKTTRKEIILKAARAQRYVAPGKPEYAAELAFRDASLSHDKNGIYGEMIVAAMISAAFVMDDVEEIIYAGLSEIPEDSRLTKAVRDLVQWSKEYPEWSSCWDRAMEDYSDLAWVHTINNTLFILLGLLYGESDLGKTVSISVMCGHDTDCTGASAGSIIGTMLGAKALESRWVEPLQDRVKSSLAGFSESRISDLARRTCALGNR